VYLIGNIAPTSWSSLWESHLAVIDFCSIPSQDGTLNASGSRSRKRLKRTGPNSGGKENEDDDVPAEHRRLPSLESASYMSRTAPSSAGQSNVPEMMEKPSSVGPSVSFASARMLPVLEMLEHKRTMAPVATEKGTTQPLLDHDTISNTSDTPAAVQARQRDQQHAESIEGEAMLAEDQIEVSPVDSKTVRATASGESNLTQASRASGTRKLEGTEIQVEPSTPATCEESSKENHLESRHFAKQPLQKTNTVENQSKNFDHVELESPPESESEVSESRYGVEDGTSAQARDPDEDAHLESGFEAWMIDQISSEADADFSDTSGEYPSLPDDPLDAVTETFAASICSLPDINILLKIAVNGNKLSARTLTEVLPHMLAAFANELAWEANDPKHRAFAKHVRRRVATISPDIVRRVHRENENAFPQSHGLHGRTLNPQAITPDTKHASVATIPVGDQDPLDDFSLVILSSGALTSFKRSLTKLIRPSFRTILTDLLRSVYISTPIAQNPIVGHVVKELKTAIPQTIRYTKNGVTMSDRVKFWIEGITRQEWDWWPLLSPKEPLQAGYVRVEWLSVWFIGCDISNCYG
jgi:hypothetical protein